MRIGSLLLLGLLGPVALQSQSPLSGKADPRLNPVPSRGPLASDHVAGRVLRATDKRPIAAAIVSLHEGSNRRLVASTRTDAEGRYRFESQPAGKYNLQASATGYLSSSYLEHDGFSTAVVLGAGLKTDDLTLELTPSAVIAGRILDESGDPVERASLILFRENTMAESSPTASTGPRVSRYRNAQTDDEGSFEFTGVAPGQFYLSVTATPWYAVHAPADTAGGYAMYRTAVDPALDVAYPELFYPGARSVEEATPFVVKAGEHLTADMVLRAEHALTLSLRLPPSQPGDARGYSVPQLSHTVFGVEQPLLGQNSRSDGHTVTLTGLAPGHYTLRQFSTAGVPLITGSVEIGGESVTMDMPSGTAPGGAPVTVKLRGPDGAALPSGIQLTLRSTVPGSPPLQSLRKGEDVAEFDAVAPGAYRFFASREGRALPTLALTQEGKPVPGKRLQVSGPDALQAELTLSPYAPEIDGFAQREGRGVPGSMVVLVPAGAEASEDLFRRDQSDLDGSFVLRNVVPGNYLLVAIEDGWPLRWNDAKVLLPYLLHAVPLTVPASGAATIRLTEAAVAQPR